jgi:hypothetical protein
MSMPEPGLDRHFWESEWQALEPLIADSPGETLPELDNLIERMMVEAGYSVSTPDSIDDEGIDPEVMASFRVAREITRKWESDRDDDPGDVAHAVNLYRELYGHLVNREFDIDG